MVSYSRRRVLQLKQPSVELLRWEDREARAEDRREIRFGFSKEFRDFINVRLRREKVQVQVIVFKKDLDLFRIVFVEDFYDMRILRVE